jgi:hypothetical protein
MVSHAVRTRGEGQHWGGPPMTRAPSTFRQRDVTRAIKAVVAAGVDIGRIRVEITRAGSIIVTSAISDFGESGEENEWDQIR